MSDLLNILNAMSKVPNQVIDPESGQVFKQNGTLIKKESIKVQDEISESINKEINQILDRDVEIKEEKEIETFPEFDAYLNMMNQSQPILENRINNPTQQLPEIKFDDSNLISCYADKINDRIY